MKKKKWLLYGVLPLMITIFASFLFLAFYTDRLVDPYVRSLLEVTKPMDHKIQYKKIRVNLLQGFILIKEASIFPDTVLTKHDLRMKINLKDIRLTGFSISQMLFNKTLRIEEFLIENPEVKLTLPDSTHKVVNSTRKHTPQKVSPYLLTKISLEKILLSGGSFQLIRNDKILAQSAAINLIAQSISLVNNNDNEPIGFAYGDINLNLADIELRPETGLYDMNLAEFSFTKSDSTIVLEGFTVIPKYDKREFSDKLEFQNDRFDIEIGQIKIGRVGFQRFIDNQPLKITSIIIDEVNADIYRDKNVRFNFDRFPLFYNESFLKIPIPISIDTLLLANSKIQYGEQAVGQPVAGTIILEDFALQSYNLTNQTEEDVTENVMHLNVQANVMGEGPMNLEIVLPLEDNLHDFECSGSVGAMKLNPLNDMLEPSINMKIKDGKLNQMRFSFTANDNFSKGWMEFLYKDLDVILMKKEPEKEWGFISLLANSMVLTNNPAKGKDLKIVEIGYQRDKNKGIINYAWKTIQSGMIHTILPIKKYQINRKHNSNKKTSEKNKEKNIKKNKK